MAKLLRVKWAYIQLYVYNIISNLSHANKGRLMEFSVGDKVSPIQDIWKFDV